MNLNQVKFKWNYLNKEHDMLFVGGMFGVSYSDLDKSIKPIFGYGICQENN